MTPVEPALDTFKVCAGLREEILKTHVCLDLSTCMNLYEHLKVKLQLQTGFVICSKLSS